MTLFHIKIASNCTKLAVHVQSVSSCYKQHALKTGVNVIELSFEKKT